MNELVAFRFESIESELKKLVNANHEMVEGISTITMEIGKIYSNLDRIIVVSSDISERIGVLENDLQERALRKKIYKSLFALYPIVILFLMILIGMDHQRILEMINIIRMIP